MLKLANLFYFGIAAITINLIQLSAFPQSQDKQAEFKWTNRNDE